MSLDMFGAVPLKAPAKTVSAKVSALAPGKTAPLAARSTASPKVERSVPPVRTETARPPDPPAADAAINALVRDLRAHGAQHRDHASPRVAVLARKALTAAESIRIQGGSIDSPGAKAAASTLAHLKSALAEPTQGSIKKTGSVDATKFKMSPAQAQAQADAARARLKVSAQKLSQSARGLASRAASRPKKGPGTAKVTNRALKIAQRAGGQAQKLLSLASKRLTPKIEALRGPAAKFRVGDDAADLAAAKQALADAEQAYADEVAWVEQVSGDLVAARQVRDVAVSNPPPEFLPHEGPMAGPARKNPAHAAWMTAADAAEVDYVSAMDAALTLIFKDSLLGDAAAALADAEALVAALEGLPPPPPPPSDPGVPGNGGGGGYGGGGGGGGGYEGETEAEGGLMVEEGDETVWEGTRGDAPDAPGVFVSRGEAADESLREVFPVEEPPDRGEAFDDLDPGEIVEEVWEGESEETVEEEEQDEIDPEAGDEGEEDERDEQGEEDDMEYVVGGLHMFGATAPRAGGWDEVRSPSKVTIMPKGAASLVFGPGIARVAVVGGNYWKPDPGFQADANNWDSSGGSSPTITLFFLDGSKRVFKGLDAVSVIGGTLRRGGFPLHVARRVRVGGVDLEPFARSVPGLLQTAGGALSGKQQVPQVQQAQQPQKPKETGGTLKTVAWVAAALAALGVVGVFLRKVIAS